MTSIRIQTRKIKTRFLDKLTTQVVHKFTSSYFNKNWIIFQSSLRETVKIVKLSHAAIFKFQIYRKNVGLIFSYHFRCRMDEQIKRVSFWKSLVVCIISSISKKEDTVWLRHCVVSTLYIKLLIKGDVQQSLNASNNV